MRSLPTLTLAWTMLAIVACQPTPTPFDVEIENTGDEPLYLVSNWETVNVSLLGEFLGGWQRLSSQNWCSRECGRAGGVDCMDIAWVDAVYALLPGDTVEVPMSGRAWETRQDAFGSCQKEIALEGGVRVEVCAGLEAKTYDDELVDVAESGLVTEAWVDSTTTCFTGETVLPEQPTVRVEAALP